MVTQAMNLAGAWHWQLPDCFCLSVASIGLLRHSPVLGLFWLVAFVIYCRWLARLLSSARMIC